MSRKRIPVGWFNPRTCLFGALELVENRGARLGSFHERSSGDFLSHTSWTWKSGFLPLLTASILINAMFASYDHVPENCDITYGMDCTDGTEPMNGVLDPTSRTQQGSISYRNQNP